MKKYIIIPGCSDLNRGDQALVWETKRIAEEAGYIGEYYLTSEKNEPVEQSERKGLKIITPILEHPSRKFKRKQNICYTKALKIKWGIVAMFDLLFSLLILCNLTRCLISCFLEEEKKRSLSLMKDADAIFMKGGGVLQTYGGVTSTYSMYFWVYPILLAHKLKKPVYIMPNSFGPFEGPFVKCIARFALKKCRVVTSRESYSQKTIKEQLGLDIENYPDLAFELPKSNLDKVSIFEKYKLPNDKKLVAITMRPYRFPTCTNPKQAYETFKNEMAAFIEELYTNGFMPVIIEHTMAVNDHENDGACIRDVIKKIDKEKYRFITDTTFDCYDLKCIYSFCDYIVGTRFHSVIFSLGSGVPGIAISYIGNKSTGIMHDIGLDDYVIDIADVTCERLITKLKNLVQEQDIVMSKINAYRTLSQQKRRILVDSLKDK